ncbi:hypothetical protein LINPERHAP1_LOCUS28182 [Linum perenne]
MMSKLEATMARGGNGIKMYFRKVFRTGPEVEQSRVKRFNGKIMVEPGLNQD